ncbi:MAG: GTP-binding protein [Streptosporangiales bacterium]|nr:GTP-binding protein [Streptosporangiales bacterium]
MHTLNLGILAHVNAGKTSLTERLLFTAGVIDEIGSVDDGSTQTDSLDLERQRGITIKSAVVSFDIGGRTINLIDTPGHPDFVAEVGRVLTVLDAAVLVVSAVEGVQAQTRVLMRALRRLRVPTLIFVNKIDRTGARPADVLTDMADRLTPAVVAMGTTSGAGTKDARFRPYAGAESDHTAALLELLVDNDDELLAAYLADDSSLPPPRLRDELVRQTVRACVHPVFAGSAITGAGVDELVSGLRTLLPPTAGEPDGPVAGTVFKIDRGPADERIAYVRMTSGTLRLRDRVRLGDQEPRVTGIRVFARGSHRWSTTLTAGQIGTVTGLDTVRIGDHVGTADAAGTEHFFGPPSLETVISPRDPAERRVLHAALTRLAEQDPLIDVRQDDTRREISVPLYGEVLKQVIEATLADDFGIAVNFRETTTLCIERPVGTSSAVEAIGTDSNPFLATVGLRVEPAALDTGVRFELAVELGSLPYAFVRAVEETVHDTLTQGLHGWQVTDCTVTMTHSGYWARQSHAHGVFDKSMSSTAGDFRNLTPLVLMSALARAGTHVCEPIHAFRLEVPADTPAAALRTLAAMRAVPRRQEIRGSLCTVEGDIPAARVSQLQQQLPSASRGEGVLECTFDHYAPVTDEVPCRPRTDHNPLDRKEYLLRVARLQRATQK